MPFIDNCASNATHAIVALLAQLSISRKYLTEDPLAGYKIKKPKPTPQPCWSPEEVEQILAASSRQPHHDVFVTLADTGMRIGELIHLTRDDIDIANNVIHIRPKKGWKTKTGDIRGIPMTSRVAAVLQAQPRRFQWVFTVPASSRGHESGRKVSSRRLLDYLQRRLKQLKLKGHLHTFRHSHVSHAIARGVAVPVLRSWIGHIDPKTLDLYTHIASKTAQAANRAIEPTEDASVNAAQASREVETKSSTNLAQSMEDPKCA
jgi:integrase/recombinase XerD